jgi:hypothetical protein
MQALTIAASIRPGRVAVLCDIADPEWMRSCRHILEIFSTLWGGHGNIIIPTDGKTIQPIFWQILETFDPDHVCEYRPSLRDLEERDPQHRAVPASLQRLLHSILLSQGMEG